jgi:hypothetical protein
MNMKKMKNIFDESLTHCNVRSSKRYTKKYVVLQEETKEGFKVILASKCSDGRIIIQHTFYESSDWTFAQLPIELTFDGAVKQWEALAEDEDYCYDNCY